MKDTDRDRAGETRRPGWVDSPGAARAPRSGDDDPPAAPPGDPALADGRQEGDGLWVHATEIGVLAIAGTVLAAVFIPRHVPCWQLSFLGAAATAVTWWVALRRSVTLAVPNYLAAWGAALTGWLTAARLTSPWREMLVYALLLLAVVMIPAGVPVIRRDRDRAARAAGLGRDNMNVRECRHWEDLLTRLEEPHVEVRDVIKVDGGFQVHCRHARAAAGRRISRPPDADLARRICVHKRLPKGAVYIEEEPAGGSAADFIIHVRTVTGPRLSRYLPAENTMLSINKPFGLGVQDTGRPWRLLLRERRVFICGIPGAGKSTLLNVLIAQLARMPDALIFMIDLKGGQEAMAWLLPWLRGDVDRPVIEWLATTREEADAMLDALKRAGQARSESGRYGKKLRPGPDRPAIIVISDETTGLTGHFLSENGMSTSKLAVKLLHISETYRSVAIDPVVSSVRAVVDNTGNSGIKAMSGVRIGMRVGTREEGQQIFPDDLAAARQLAQLKDHGMFIPKVGAELSPPVHGYNITDGEPDDDGNPTEDLITPIAVACAARRPRPEQLVIDAMGDAYEHRWDQPHIAKLTEQWRQAAGDAPAPPAPRPGRDDRDVLEDMIRADPLLSELDEAAGDEDGGKLHPAHKRMRQLLIERGPAGWRVDPLWHQLLSEGHSCARETVHRWLARDEKRGYVYRTGKPRSKWIWRLREGEEFDLPGMS